MTFKRLELHDYSRFPLDGLRGIRVTPSAPIQIILGTNGSGKSALLSQCNPLPAEPDEFDDLTGKRGKGRKIYETIKSGKHYLLTSDYSRKQPHSFEVDGENLNESGLISMQRELVFKHFGINKEISDLISGRVKFTSMPLSKRKEWLIKLSDCDYSYAISVYNRVKEHHSSIVGALRIAKRTLLAESQNLPDDEYLKTLDQNVEQLQAGIAYLYELKRPAPIDEDIRKDQAREVDRNLDRLNKQAEQLKQAVGQIALSSSEIEEGISGENKTLEAIHAAIEVRTTEYDNVLGRMAVLQKAEAATADQVASEVERLTQQMTKHEWVLSAIGQDDADPKRHQHARQRLEAIRSDLLAATGALPENADRKYSQTTLAEYRAEVSRCETSLIKLGQEVAGVEASINHQEKHRANPDTKCPKCEHTYSTGFEPTLYAELCTRHSQLKNAIHKLTEEHKVAQAKVADCLEYATNFRVFASIESSNPELTYLWKRLSAESVILIAPSTVHVYVQEALNFYTSCHEYMQLRAQRDEKAELCKMLRAIGSADLTALKRRSEELSEEVSALTGKLKACKDRMEHLQQCKRNLASYAQMRERLVAAIRKRHMHHLFELDSLRIEAVNAGINALQTELAVNVHERNKAKGQLDVIRRINSDIENLTNEEKAAAVLLTELSPNKGLIAEGLLGFINGFIEQMNTIIKAVWSYSLVIKSCDFDDSSLDLDYRFPFFIPNKVKPVPDVSSGSAGQREIIDLAFQITVQRLLKLQDEPLLLDELGAGFDETHKAETVKIIQALIDQGIFRQVFLVSHDYLQYGALSNCEVTVMNSLNICSPAGLDANKHVEFFK